ncbi:hypothetical protein SADUNF_Sadunf01G0064000 [Salix dunnii]|uniref:Uncharacterized protein n=1 Tax=Salix dunnii TaxID=1413687 RepID=A0A835NA60_9ROSI|nr:hypothetical protein SADUNF_Sadunf01G0064000 [Salix dunnii]
MRTKAVLSHLLLIKAYRFLSQENPYCLLIVTPKGDRLWWIAGAEAPLGSPWTDTVVTFSNGRVDVYNDAMSYGLSGLRCKEQKEKVHDQTMDF